MFKRLLARAATLLALWPLGGGSAPAHAQQAPGPATGTAPVSGASAGNASADASALLAQGSEALRAGRAQQALQLLQQAIAAEPESAPANLLAASAELALFAPEAAIRYGERALALEPDNWKIHTTLVTAYAMAGDVQHREAERALLRKAHENPALPDARETSGFLLDVFRVKAYRVEAVEYFHPLGRSNTYFRFLVRGAGGAKVWTIEVNSDPRNQSSWAQSYPQQAAEGQRQFQIESAQGEIHVDYSTFSGSPSYDYMKAQVTKIVAAQAVPFPGEAQAH